MVPATLKNPCNLYRLEMKRSDIMGKLDGKVAIITGAGSGFGRATTLLFTHEGASVLVMDRDEAGANATVAEVERSHPGKASVFIGNVTSSADCAGMVRAAVERYGKLDILFNNAGIGGKITGLEMMEEEDWDNVLAVNLKSVFLGAKYAFPELKKNGGGVILNTASVSAFAASPGYAAYTSSKAGVVQLTKLIALEGAPYRIRSNAICPSFSWTPLVQRGIAERFPGAEERVKQALAQASPLNDLVTAEEVAALALHLVSDEARFITGTAQIIDGGLSAGINR
jgi:NAD(P)-dependent dehydrogenase (short-subunit alcohol dehydrogenase family)